MCALPSWSAFSFRHKLSGLIVVLLEATFRGAMVGAAPGLHLPLLVTTNAQCRGIVSPGGLRVAAKGHRGLAPCLARHPRPNQGQHRQRGAPARGGTTNRTPQRGLATSTGALTLCALLQMLCALSRTLSAPSRTLSAQTKPQVPHSGLPQVDAYAAVALCRCSR